MEGFVVVLLSAKLKLVFTPSWNSFQIVDKVFILRCIAYFESVSRLLMSIDTMSSSNSFSITHLWARVQNHAYTTLVITCTIVQTWK